MKESLKEALRWWRQAENDLGYAKVGLKEGYYAQVCFQAHQVAEKAIKSILYGHYNRRFVLGHSLVKLAGEVDIGLNEETSEGLHILDQYYIPTRYPNGLPEAAPFEVYTKKQAKEAVQTAETLLLLAKKFLPHDP